MRKSSSSTLKHALQLGFLFVTVIALTGAGDQTSRFNDLGHRLMCACGCNQILLECNHVGCSYSDRMRAELMTALDRGDADDLVLQSFVQKYGPTVLAAPSKSGFNRVAWIMPYLALVVGIVGVGYLLRIWKSRPLVLPAEIPAAVHGTELDHFRNVARKETEL
jgi:cytochrome c-type biogenesis protein CcmH/NrfF